MAADALTDPLCGACRANRGELAAPGGVIFQDAHWRLEHILPPIPLAGWLVLKPLRHVEALGELSAVEAATLGPLVQRIAAALQAVVQPDKVYLCQFAEAEHFAHVHFHLIPRSADLPSERRGPAIFELLSVTRREGRDLSSPGEAERIALAVRERLHLDGTGMTGRADVDERSPPAW
jgi:diadenosine tetraphosphate (Ap4A) HIT family hydrolase